MMNSWGLHTFAGAVFWPNTGKFRLHRLSSINTLMISRSVYGENALYGLNDRPADRGNRRKGKGDVDD